MLPLVLDDVLVNFDGERAVHAAQTLKTFAELGHQVMMFTCHEHIVEIFHEIDVEVRLMPPQGEPGRATVLEPEYEEEEEEFEEEEVVEEEVAEVEPEPVVVIEPEPVVVVQPAPEPKVIYVEKPAAKKAKPKKRVKPRKVFVEPEPEYLEPKYIEPEYVEPEYIEPQYVEPVAESIGWAWFEQSAGGQEISTEQRAANTLLTAQQAIDSEYQVDYGPGPGNIDEVPEDVWNRHESWWDGNQVNV